MRQLLFFVIILSIASKSYGQTEFSKKFKAIPPLTTKINTKLNPKKDSLPTPNLPKFNAPSVFNTPNTLGMNPNTNADFSLYPKNEFKNPGDLIVEKLNKIPFNDEGIAYKKDQNLGSFKIKSYTAKVFYRDYGEVDGDAIRVYINGVPIITRIIMDRDFRSFDIALEHGSNKIDFEALNVGYASPNTAEFQVYDDKGDLVASNQWSLFTGFKATIILIKEK
jgi:hypothetical protein